ADAEVLAGALRLRAPEVIGGYGHVAKAILLDTSGGGFLLGHVRTPVRWTKERLRGPLEYAPRRAAVMAQRGHRFNGKGARHGRSKTKGHAATARRAGTHAARRAAPGASGV